MTVLQAAVHQVFSYTRDFLKYVIIFILSMCIFQLRYQIGKHTAGYLIHQCLDINAKHLRIQQTAL